MSDLIATMIAAPVAFIMAYMISVYVWGTVWMLVNKADYPYFPIGKLRLMTDGIEYGEWYFVYWWNWLPKSQRYWGYEEIPYDGMPFKTYGLWFTNVSWVFPWSKHDERA